CGGDGGPKAAPTGFGVYVAQAGTAERGTRFVYEVPAPVEDAAVSHVERFRTAVGGPEVTYLLVGADASRAARDIAVNLGSDVIVVTDDGPRGAFHPPSDPIAAWLSRPGAPVTTQLREQGSQLVLDYQLGAI